MQRVGRRTTEDSRSVLDECAQSWRASQTAAGQAKKSLAGRGFERRPEPKKGPKRKGEIDTVSRLHSTCAVNARPVVEHPCPALRGVENCQGPRGCPARLAEAC